VRGNVFFEKFCESTIFWRNEPMISLYYSNRHRGISNLISEITMKVPSWRHKRIIYYNIEARRIGLMKKVPTLISERIKYIYTEFLNVVHIIVLFPRNKIYNNIIIWYMYTSIHIYFVKNIITNVVISNGHNSKGYFNKNIK